MNYFFFYDTATTSTTLIYFFFVYEVINWTNKTEQLLLFLHKTNVHFFFN